MQKTWSTALHKMIEEFKSVSTKAMQLDSDMLFLTFNEDICIQFVIRSIRDMSRRNSVRRQTDRDLLAKSGCYQNVKINSIRTIFIKSSYYLSSSPCMFLIRKVA